MSSAGLALSYLALNSRPCRAHELQRSKSKGDDYSVTSSDDINRIMPRPLE